MPIHILSDLVVAQIAAGEVVERPASVIKELIENALDAGATHIQVAVTGGGQQMIRISDNGSGIRAAEVELAFARHATSKLANADDLLHLLTLGFRGEALCSIAAVSQVTCVTRHHHETIGTKLVIEGGDITVKTAIGAPAGTIITVENLFYNVPARLKFLKKDATEKRQIAQVVTLMAMAYPTVRFVLDQDGREAFRSPGTGKLDDVLVAAYGVEDAKRLVPIHAVSAGIEVSGYASSAELWRTDRNRIHIFVNGRVVQDFNLTKAVTQAYQSIFQDGQYPVAALMVRVPLEDVDVNVHPTKAEVRFRDASAVFMAIQRAVREGVVGGRPLLPDVMPNAPRTFSNFGMAAPSSAQLGMGFDELPTAPNIPRVVPAGQPEDEYEHIPEGAGVPRTPRTLPVLRVVGQIGARYIIAEGPAGVYLIDQHNAHTRVLYAQLHAHLTAGSLTQTEAIPGTAIFPPASAKLLEQLTPVLATLGIDLEPFGPNTYRILRAPEMLDGFDCAAILEAILPDSRTDDPQDAILRGLCRLAAVKSGQLLNQEQMQALVRLLERTPEPYLSPDGNPTILHMSSEQLLKEFRR